MDEDFNTTVYVILASICEAVIAPPKYNPKMTPAEILLVAIVAARYFNNNLERALILLKQTGYISKQRCLSVSRFNRQLHRYRDLLNFCLETLLEVSRSGEAFVLDSMPVPVCKRKRARRCRKVRGRIFCGYCAAKDEKFFGWRLHLVCTPAGLPSDGHRHRVPLAPRPGRLPAPSRRLGLGPIRDGPRSSLWSV